MSQGDGMVKVLAYHTDQEQVWGGRMSGRRVPDLIEPAETVRGNILHIEGA
jgi:hypothetical protein